MCLWLGLSVKATTLAECSLLPNGHLGAELVQDCLGHSLVSGSQGVPQRRGPGSFYQGAQELTRRGDKSDLWPPPRSC